MCMYMCTCMYVCMYVYKCVWIGFGAWRGTKKIFFVTQLFLVCDESVQSSKILPREENHNIKAQHSVVFDVWLSLKNSLFPKKINKTCFFLGLSIFCGSKKTGHFLPFSLLLKFINPQTSCHSIEALFAYIVTFTTNILMSAMSSAVRMAANMSMKVRVDGFSHALRFFFAKIRRRFLSTAAWC